jgi:hypothetical protein
MRDGSLCSRMVPHGEERTCAMVKVQPQGSPADRARFLRAVGWVTSDRCRSAELPYNPHFILDERPSIGPSTVTSTHSDVRNMDKTTTADFSNAVTTAVILPYTPLKHGDKAAHSHNAVLMRYQFYPRF